MPINNAVDTLDKAGYLFSFIKPYIFLGIKSAVVFIIICTRLLTPSMIVSYPCMPRKYLLSIAS